ncbi:MAG: phycobilisome rod-core linker polypeptide [Cyanobacteria bacterium P01_C01_bin.72]
MLKKLFKLGKKSQQSNVAVQEKPRKTISKTESKATSNGKSTIFTPVVIAEKTLAEKYRDSLATSSVVTLSNDSLTKNDVELVIRAAYKQVFGNAHFMESERLREAESQIRFGQITTRDFIRLLATSERYKSLFWEKYSTPVFVELNFKHLLGRAPESYAEIAQHMQILAESGFEAEIDSYLDSDEYAANFGDFSVPYFRGYNSQIGRNNVGFTHAFPLAGLACSSDKSLYVNASSKLETNLIKNKSSNIPAIRPIPESYPESFAPAPEPRIPKEYRDMAFEITKSLRNNPKYVNYQRLRALQ